VKKYLAKWQLHYSLKECLNYKILQKKNMKKLEKIDEKINYYRFEKDPQKTYNCYTRKNIGEIKIIYKCNWIKIKTHEYK